MFRIGDRIVYCEGGNYNYLVGKKGRIVEILGLTCGIEFDEYMGGHMCNGDAKMGHGYYVETEFVRLDNINKRI